MSTSIGKINPDVIVIGGGAAGMSAALFAASEGANVLLLEKNEKLGKKVYITGKGRCNLTNLCDQNEFLNNVPRNPRFLYSALSLLPPQETIELMEAHGCPTKVERGNRVFPVSDKASDVTKAWLTGLWANHVAISYQAEVRHVLVENGQVTGVEMISGEKIACTSVIVATGGLSYPSTGSTGDGYRFATETGHHLIPCVPSLVPYETKDIWCSQLQGLSLKNVCLSAEFHGKILYRELGEMLFTHFGVSGPLVLTMSSELARLNPEEVDVRLDLKPALTPEQVSMRLQKEFSQSGKKMLRSVMPSLLPARFAELFPALCHVDAGKCVSQISLQEREQLVQGLKGLKINLSGTRPMTEAIITSGGVSVQDISSKTMMSKLVRNLYFAGEVIDVDAHTGGFNLQIAFSTGALAGKNAAHPV